MYHDDRLKEMRLNFLRDNRKSEYRRLRRDGELEEHLQECATACRMRAKSYVDSGETHEGQAWQWAIRVVLLETPPD